MRNLAIGALVIAGLWMATEAIGPGRDRLAASQYGTPSTGGELIAWTTSTGEHRQVLTVLDPRTRALAIYHVDPTNGAVSLKSARNLHWDLQMSEFNAISPLPREIRSMLESR